jgi:hypothetical protein
LRGPASVLSHRPERSAKKEGKEFATNLRGPADIAGTYGAVGAGGAFIAGAQAATLQNESGVIVTLQGVEVGFDVNIGLAGMTITLQ